MHNENSQRNSEILLNNPTDKLKQLQKDNEMYRATIESHQMIASSNYTAALESSQHALAKPAYQPQLDMNQGV